MTPMLNEASAERLIVCKLLALAWAFPLSPSTTENWIAREGVVRGMAVALNRNETVRFSWRVEEEERRLMVQPMLACRH